MDKRTLQAYALIILAALIIAAAVSTMVYFSADRKTARRLRKERGGATDPSDEVLPPP